MRYARRLLRSRRMMLPSAAEAVDYNAALNSGLLHAWPFDADYNDDKGSLDFTAYNSPSINTTVKLIGTGSLETDYTAKSAVRNTTYGTIWGNNLVRSQVIWYRPQRSPDVGQTFTLFVDLRASNVARVQIYHQSNDNLGAIFARKAGGVNGLDSGAGTVNIGSWNMVYVCHDADNDQIILNLNNGAATDSAAFDTTGIVDDVYAGQGIGMYHTGDTDWCDGYFDDTWMWNRPLTDAEINWLWNGGAGRELTIS